MDKIVDRLYLGNLKGASNLQNLKAAGITHILQVASGIKPFFPKDFKYKVISVTDTSQSSLIRHFPAAVAFIKEGMAKGGVLVHCYAGVSRSASCVIAYFMQERDMTFQQAFAFASKRRPVIFPNMGFQRQLCEYEKLLHLKKSYSSPNRVDKLAQKVLGNNDSILKQVNRSLMRGPADNQNNAMFTIPSTTVTDKFFDAEVPQADDYQRVTFFDRSNAFGFSEDKLGRLAEINKSQLQSALKDLNSFARTDAGFNRQLYQRGNVANKNQNVVAPTQRQEFSPQKHRADQAISTLKLAKQPMSHEASWALDPQSKKNSHSFTTTMKQKNTPIDTYQQISGIQKQGSVENLRGSGRPKTNQSSKKPFGAGQVSIDQNIKQNFEAKNYSLTMSGHPKKGTKNSQVVSDFKRAHQSSLQQLQSIVPDSPIFRRNQVGNLDSLFGQSAYQQLGQQQKAGNAANANQARQLYVCVGCNTPLFTNKDLIGHNEVAASTTGRFIQKQPCNCFYIKQREWMPGFAGNEGDPAKGMLECYRKVCKRKLGQYNKDGLQCNCGKVVRPGYAINKAKVKLVGHNVYQANLGQSNSNSIQNLHSSSELGAYAQTQPNEKFYSQSPLLLGNGGKREVIVPKSHENRKSNLKTKDSKQRISINSRKPLPEPISTSKRKHVSNVITSNMSNSAYTRAERILQFPDYRKGNGSTDNTNFGASDPRDPYSGFTKVFIMPSSQSEYTSAGYTIPKKIGGGQGAVGEMLRDTEAQSRVVDNVMNFFRYKEQPQGTESLPSKHVQYTDGILYNNKIQSQDNSLLSISLKPTVEQFKKSHANFEQPRQNYLTVNRTQPDVQKREDMTVLGQSSSIQQKRTPQVHKIKKGNLSIQENAAKQKHQLISKVV